MENENKLPIAASTIIRLIVLFVATLNQVLTNHGINPIPFSDDEIYIIASWVVFIGIIGWSFWKNNNFTQAALQAQEVLDAIKEQKRYAKLEMEDDEECNSEELM